MIFKKFHLRKGSKVLVEEADGGIIILKPLVDTPVDDPVEKSRGILKGKNSILKSLLDDRAKEPLRDC